MAFSGNTQCTAFKKAAWLGGVNFATVTFKLALYTNAATLNAATPAYTASNEVVASGYTPGGVALTVSQQPVIDPTTGVVYANFANVSIPAALTARGALIYMVDGNNTAVAVLDFGADKTSTTNFLVQMPASGPTTALLQQ